MKGGEVFIAKVQMQMNTFVATGTCRVVSRVRRSRHAYAGRAARGPDFLARRERLARETVQLH